MELLFEIGAPVIGALVVALLGIALRYMGVTLKAAQRAALREQIAGLVLTAEEHWTEELSGERKNGDKKLAEVVLQLERKVPNKKVLKLFAGATAQSVIEGVVRDLRGGRLER